MSVRSVNQALPVVIIFIEGEESQNRGSSRKMETGTTPTANTNSTTIEQPTSPPTVVVGKDEDAIKLFVGQIPKDMGEETLRPVFEEYGSIFDLTIIRDKASGYHRGCAFLTYTTKAAAETALEALHNKCKLPNAQNTLQVCRGKMG